MDGESANNQFGRSVSLSNDGTTSAVDAIKNDGNGSNSGHVQVYQLDSSKNWIQVGNDVDGESTNDQLGRSVSLSNDGTTLAVGAPHNNGDESGSRHAQVYQLFCPTEVSRIRIERVRERRPRRMIS